MTQSLRVGAVLASSLFFAFSPSAQTPPAPGSPAPVTAAWSLGTLDLRVPKPVPAVLKVTLPRPARLQILITGPDGRLVRTLVRDAKWPAGSRDISWDGLDDDRRPVPSEAYTPFIQERHAGSWTPIFNPNADNHGRKAEVTAVQWDPVAGKVLFYLAVPARIRVWVVLGDDGQILATLKDMEPVRGGLLALNWGGSGDGAAGNNAKPGFSFKGYELPAASLVVESPDPETYLAARSRYAVLEPARPRAYEDSSPLHRADYAEQKELRFHASLQGRRLRIEAAPEASEIFQKRNLGARLFFEDGTWRELDLHRNPGKESAYEAALEREHLGPAARLTLLLYTDADQYGHSAIQAE